VLEKQQRVGDLAGLSARADPLLELDALAVGERAQVRHPQLRFRHAVDATYHYQGLPSLR
jgi:hypothetical protein